MATEPISDIPRRPGQIKPAPPHTPPPGGKRSRSWLDTLIVLAKRRRPLLLTAVICTALGALIAFLMPNEYAATVVLMPPQHGSSIASELLSSMGGMSSLAEFAGSSLGLKNTNDLYVAELKTHTVEDGVIHQFNLMKEYHARYLSRARKTFEDHVTIKGSGKDGLIHISVEDPNPQRAVQLANGYVDQFRRLTRHLAGSAAGQRAQFFQQQMDQAKGNLNHAEDALKQTEQTTGLIQLGAQARALIESAAMLRGQITAKKVEIQALSSFATSQNVQLQQARTELASLQAQLDALGGSDQSPNSLLVPKGKVPEAGLEYARKLRDVKYYEAIFEVLAKQFELAKLEQAKEGAPIQVIDPPIVPDHKSWPPRALIILGAALFGLLLGVGIALGQQSLANLKSTPEGGARILELRRALQWKRTA